MGPLWLQHYDPGVPFSIDYPQIPLYQLLDDSAGRQSERPCTNFYGKCLSYGRVKAESNNMAFALGQIGVTRGDKVCLLLPNSPQFVITYHAVLKAGAVVVPLNPLANPNELTIQLSDADCRTLITIPLFLEKAAGIQKKISLKRIVYSRLADYMPFPLGLVMRIREQRQLRIAHGAGLYGALNYTQLVQQTAPLDFKPVRVNPQDLGVLLYSGGTTGAAKGIMLSHAACVANAHQLRAWGQLKPTDRLLSVLPLFHGYGMSVNMNAGLLAGSEMVLVPRFNAREVLKIIQKRRPTFFTGVPTMFLALNSLSDIAQYDLSSLQGIFVGAAPLTKALKDVFEKKTGSRMIEGYGLTEAVTAIMANPYHGMHKVGSIGIPMSDVVAKVVDLDNGRDIPQGKLGEIILQSPSLMSGYYKRPQETSSTLVDGWLYTGDIGYMDEDGYFYITDRKRDLIIVSGFNVFPREIEDVLYQHPKVQEGVAIGIPDFYAGERVKVFVVLKAKETATQEEFIHYFRQYLTRYKVPSAVEFRAELPKSMIGKILRRVLREEHLEAAASDAKNLV